MATIINMVVGGTTKRPTIPHFCPPLYGRLTRRFFLSVYSPSFLFSLKFFIRCWDQDPFRRPTFAQILDCLQVIVGLIFFFSFFFCFILFTISLIFSLLHFHLEKEGDLPSPNSIPLRLRDSAEPEPQPPE